MAVRTRLLWPSRLWRWALFCVALVTVLITGFLYELEINRQVARFNQNTVMNVAPDLRDKLKKTLPPKIMKGNNPHVTPSTKSDNNTVTTYKGSNEAVTVKGSNLMIVSYMRSGSSMNGRVFGENPENFYIFEPLIKLAPHHYLTEDKICEVKTNSCRTDPEPNNAIKTVIDMTTKAVSALQRTTASVLKKTTYRIDPLEIEDYTKASARKLIEAAVRNLKNIYKCNIRNLDDNILRSIMFEWIRGSSKSGESWNNFTKCYIKLVKPDVTDFPEYVKKAVSTEFNEHRHVFRLLDQAGPTTDVFRHCLDNLVSFCQKAKLRVTKVLRVSLRFLPLLMKEIPDLKVISIIRDPRGIINSRIKTDWYPIKDDDPQPVKENIKSLCFKIQEDIDMTETLKRQFPGRFLDYSLEELVKNPMENYQTIFKFANLEMTDKYSKMIKEIYGDRPAFLNQWNSTLNQKYIQWIQRFCHRGLTKYGFEKVNFRHLKKKPDLISNVTTV